MNNSKNISDLVRPNIRDLKPYSSARDEFRGEAAVFLDANENPYPSPFNRYPDPLQISLKTRISAIKKIPVEQIFLGNGSDEAIDLIIRAFCEPGRDTILIPEPTYGMYAVCAGVNDVQVKRVLLTDAYDVDMNAIQAAIDATTKIVFLCSPNNPSGNLLSKEPIIEFVEAFTGLVVIDEAYIDFAGDPGFANMVDRYPNLVVLQTFSKAWGLAGLRLGMCFASEFIIGILNKIKYPYNISSQTQQLALQALENEAQKNKWVKEILEERERLALALDKLDCVSYVHPSDANFVLVRVSNAATLYKELMEAGTIVRDRSKVVLCENSLRITVGTPEENSLLISQMKKLSSKEIT